MDSMFVWILFGAGAAVAWLAVLLVTSERELKGRRGEIEALLTKLENAPQGSAPTESMQSETAPTELADLRIQNRDLQTELAALTNDLNQSRNVIADLRGSQQSSARSQVEIQQLSADNDRLSREVSELRSRLMSSEAQVQSSLAQNHDEQAGNARMQAEIDHLRAALGESQEKIRDLESVRQSLPDVNAMAAAYSRERDTLQQRIAELESRASMDQEKVAELQTVRDHLARAQSAQDELRKEIRRHEAEIPGWQARIAAGEESRRRLAALQDPCNRLISQQAALADRQRQLQEDFASFARQIAAAADSSERATPVDPGPDGNAEAHASPREAPAKSSSGNSSSLLGSDAAPAAASGRSYGTLAVLLFIAGAGVLGSRLFMSGTEQTPNRVSIAKPIQSSAPAPVIERAAKAQPQQASVEIRPTRAPVHQAAQAKPTAKEPVAPAVIDNPTVKAQPASLGTYQVVRPSRVYAAPTELASAIGDIEPGVRVNVVQARDGWLEIHSKHGRPPGFIRREVAARVSGQN